MLTCPQCNTREVPDFLKCKHILLCNQCFIQNWVSKMTRYGKRGNFQSNPNQTHGTVNITWNPDIEAYDVSFPYNETFINWIKTQIPTNKRNLDFDRSRNPQYIWQFEETTMDTVIMPMMRAIFTGAVFKIIDKKKVDEYNQGFKQPSVPVDTESLKIEFRKLVTAARVPTDIPDKKQYLRAAMFYHPDFHPERAREMSRLNEIWTTVFVQKEQEAQNV